MSSRNKPFYRFGIFFGKTAPKSSNKRFMRIAGIVLLILGLVGTLTFGIQAINQSESASFLGIDIAVSSANWMPVIISVVVLIIGIIMTAAGRKQES